MPGPELHTIPEVCRRLRVSRRTVYNLRASGEIDFLKIGRRSFVSDFELTRYLETQARKARRGGERHGRPVATG